MLQAFIKAIEQLPDPTFRAVLIKSVGLTLAVFIVVYVLASAMLDWVMPDDPAAWTFELLWLYEVDFSPYAEAVGQVVLVIALFLLFPAVSSLFTSLFLDEIAAAVEARHYPNDPPGKGLSMRASFMLSLKFSIVMIVLNVVALILYLPLLLIPILNLVVFYTINGYLFSREYFELVSSRHLAPEAIGPARRKGGVRLFLTGVGIAFVMTIPIVNLLAPLVATSAMVHVFKTLAARAPA